MSTGIPRVSQIDIALDRYRSLRRQQADFDAFHVWIDELVCPIVEQLMSDVRFREYAHWPIRHLVRTSTSPARRAIEQVDQRIVELARMVVADLDRNPNDEELRLLSNRDMCGQRSADEISIDECILRTRWAARRPWIDFVNPTDYFHPHHGLFLGDGQYAIRNLQDELIDDVEDGIVLQFTDYLTRLLILRIEFWLHPLRRVIKSALGNDLRSPISAMRPIWESEVDVDRQLDQLLSLCYTGRIGCLPESCITLTLVYMARHRLARIDWLVPREVQDAVRQFGRVRVPRQIRDVETLDRIAAALDACSEILSTHPDLDEIIQDAVHGHELVVEMGTRSIFWRGSQISVDLNTPEWELFRSLVERYKQHGSTTTWDDMPDPTTPKNFKMIKSRLVRSLKFVAPELSSAIVAVRSEPIITYQLMIPRDQIRVFSRQQREEIYEIVAIEEF